MAASTSLNAEARIKRASKAGKAAQSPETLGRRLVRDWPELTPEQKNTLRTLLRPVVGGGNG
jgi:hypothetical protein